MFDKIWKNIKDFFKNITVEPVYLFFSMSFGLYGIVSSELYIQKVCKVLKLLKHKNVCI